MTLDATGERAVAVVREAIRGRVRGGDTGLAHVSTAAVEALAREGLLAHCSCPVGFGQVVDERCPAHGRRNPAHTIAGVTV